MTSSATISAIGRTAPHGGDDLLLPARPPLDEGGGGERKEVRCSHGNAPTSPRSGGKDRRL